MSSAKQQNERSRLSGTVKWFDPQKGFGFIVVENGQEAFVHQSDVEAPPDRALQPGERVTFTTIQETRGLKALHVRAQPTGATSADSAYRAGEVLQLEEDREHEFKSLKQAKDPVRTICTYYVAEYVNAFLNTNGGAIYFGVADDGRVQGIRLDRSQKDALRNEVSRIINRFQPAVEPELYELRFVPVLNLDATYVVELHVRKGTARLYMTGSQHFYLRRDGSNFLMPFDLIRRRLQSAPQASGEARSESRSAQPDSALDLDAERVQDLDLGILLAMIFMSWSDEDLTATDVQLLRERARDDGLEEKDVKVLTEALLQPPLLETIVSYLPSHEARKAAATAAYLVALDDEVLTLDELHAFDEMCTALGLTAEEREEIRALGRKSKRLNRTTNHD